MHQEPVLSDFRYVFDDVEERCQRNTISVIEFTGCRRSGLAKPSLRTSDSCLVAAVASEGQLIDRTRATRTNAQHLDLLEVWSDRVATFYLLYRTPKLCRFSDEPAPFTFNTSPGGDCVSRATCLICHWWSPFLNQEDASDSRRQCTHFIRIDNNVPCIVMSSSGDAALDWRLFCWQDRLP